MGCPSFVLFVNRLILDFLPYVKETTLFQSKSWSQSFCQFLAQFRFLARSRIYAVKNLGRTTEKAWYYIRQQRY